MNDSYVHNGKEVAITGRTAIRKTSRGKTLVLYEIKPIDLEEGDPKFCQWVKIEDLYHIQDNINNDDGESDD